MLKPIRLLVLRKQAIHVVFCFIKNEISRYAYLQLRRVQCRTVRSMTSRTTTHISPMPGHVINVTSSAPSSGGGGGGGSDSGSSPPVSVTSGSPNHSTTNGSSSFSLNHGIIGSGGGSLYPSISAAYWLPAPNPTPYLLPGEFKY